MRWQLVNLEKHYAMSEAIFTPKLKRAKCGLCLQEFGPAPITELGDTIVHVACVP